MAGFQRQKSRASSRALEGIKCKLGVLLPTINDTSRVHTRAVLKFQVLDYAEQLHMAQVHGVPLGLYG